MILINIIIFTLKIFLKKKRFKNIYFYNDIKIKWKI